jgi:hypothetical protein
MSYVGYSVFNASTLDEGLLDFPTSYHAYIRSLAAKFPSCSFRGLFTDDNFEDVVNIQAQSALVEPEVDKSWKNLAYWDSENYGGEDGRWGRASKEIIRCCLDPRNFLGFSPIFNNDGTDFRPVWQFVDQRLPDTYNKNDLEKGVATIVKGSFMETGGTKRYSNDKINYPQTIVSLCIKYSMHPYCAAAKILLEMGSSGSSIISGTHSSYPGYYNYFNIDAYAHDGNGAVTNGLISAKKRGWNTREKALEGGIKFLAENYVNGTQNTKYLERFNILGNYTNQYMTSIYAPVQESKEIAEAYGRDLSGLTLLIPVYQNMPSTPCTDPKTGKYGTPLEGSQAVVPDTPKITFEISSKNVQSTEALLLVKVLNLTNTIDKLSYKLNNGQEVELEVPELDSVLITGIVKELMLNNLVPVTDYQLQVVVEIAGAKIESDVFTFKTLQDYPKPPRRVILEPETLAFPSKSLITSFTDVDWGYWYNNGLPSNFECYYRCKIYKNGSLFETVDLNLAGNSIGNRKIKNFEFIPKTATYAKLGDCIQVSIQPWMRRISDDHIFLDPAAYPTFSNVICLKVNTHKVFLYDK